MNVLQTLYGFIAIEIFDVKNVLVINPHQGIAVVVFNINQSDFLNYR